MFHRGRRSLGARWLVYVPLVFAGAVLFWTVAFGLAGLSLVAVTHVGAAEPCAAGAPGPTGMEPMPGHAEPITINIQESAEPEDVNDNAGAIAPVEAQFDDDDDARRPSRASGRSVVVPF